jgi:hypothetical protein
MRFRCHGGRTCTLPAPFPNRNPLLAGAIGLYRLGLDARLCQGACRKITFDIDCTPEEARAFFGLPDVRPLQQAVMAQVQEKIMANIQAMDPETIMRTWNSASMQGMEQLQQAFWNSLASMTSTGRK